MSASRDSPRRRVLFLGSKPLGLQCLRAMHRLDPASLIGAVTLDDRQDVRSAHDQFLGFAREHQIPLLSVRTRRESEAAISGFHADICFVTGWYWILGAELLAAHPFLGIHYSLLPKYRGGSPLVWQIINGEPSVGLSLFSFSAGMDEGDIWAQRTVPVGPGDPIADVLARLEAQSISVLDDLYRGILDGKITPAPQDHSQATYCSVREPADGVIDWHKPAVAVHNFVRAQSAPYPGAFTFFQGRKLTVWRARPHPAAYCGRPGQVAAVTPDGVTVACGSNTALILESVQLEGSTVSPAPGVLRSIRTRLPEESAGPHA